MSAAGAVAAFHENFGHAPAGVWSAPGRLNLIGEHLDYNNGLVLPVALPQRTFAACSTRSEETLRVYSVEAGETVDVALDDISSGRPGGWAGYAAGVLWALRAEGLSVGGLDVAIDSAVPVGAGLSSSAALACAVGVAASDLFGLPLLDDDRARARLAAVCVRAENDVVGAPTGGMDQAASLLCREGRALLLDFRDGTFQHVPLDLSGPERGYVLLVTDTRARHALVDGQYADRRRACDQAAAELGIPSLRHIPTEDLEHSLARLSSDELRRRTRHVVTEIARVRATVSALRSGDLLDVGRQLDGSHASLRDDYQVSSAELDAAVEAARRAGAVGARMTGGGFGGSTIALTPHDAVEEVAASIEAAFAARGWAPPRSFTAEASAGARRET